MAKKGGGNQTVTQKLDPATEAYQKQIYDAAQRASSQPYTPYGGQTVAGVSSLSPQGVGIMQDAAGAFGGASHLAGLGSAALGGDQDAFAKFQNPYQQSVLDSIGGDFNQIRQHATLNADDAATKAGAFGGDRHAVMLGEQLGQIDRAQGDTMAQFRNSGFNDAMGRAAQATQLGLGAAGQQYGAGQGLFGAGDYFRNVQQQGLDSAHQQFNEGRDWNLRNLDVLKSGVQGTPYGTSQVTPTNRNALAGAAGGAMTGFEIGGPWGAAIGGGLGLLGL